MDRRKAPVLTRRVRVPLLALALLVVLAVIAFPLVPHDQMHDRITVWFWTILALAALELCAIAAWDWAADRWHRLPHLVTDQDPDDEWPAWAHAIFVPVFLGAGMLVDHLWVH